MKSFKAGPDWTKVIVPLSELGTDGSDLQALMFAEVAVPGKFNLLIDDVRLER